jgi:hypothetical protein
VQKSNAQKEHHTEEVLHQKEHHAEKGIVWRKSMVQKKNRAHRTARKRASCTEKHCAEKEHRTQKESRGKEHPIALHGKRVLYTRHCTKKELRAEKELCGKRTPHKKLNITEEDCTERSIVQKRHCVKCRKEHSTEKSIVHKALYEGRDSYRRRVAWKKNTVPHKETNIAQKKIAQIGASCRKSIVSADKSVALHGERVPCTEQALYEKEHRIEESCMEKEQRNKDYHTKRRLHGEEHRKSLVSAENNIALHRKEHRARKKHCNEERASYRRRVVRKRAPHCTHSEPELAEPEELYQPHVDALLK